MRQRRDPGRALVHGDDVSTRTELVLADVLVNEIEGVVGDVFASCCHCSWSRVDLGRVGDVVALPRVRVMVSIWYWM